MSSTNYEEMLAKLKEMLKDLPPIALPSKLPVHPYEPYFNIMHNTQNGLEPVRETTVKFLKGRPSDNELKYDWAALSEKYKHTEHVTINGTAHHPDICSKCNKPWVDHEFAVPAPYCP